ncbi:class I SAM-dependent DNA methyltransferase [Nonomuraea sp. NPDC050556]|uniref:class I SAM-dependent DNA methyltransferase n=1 Tax=Nonomuraea sp. NPDC050556 TaxID=3364369 RepID=UPI0037A1485D
MTRVRDAYDSFAVEYAEFVEGVLEKSPLERAMLVVFAELVRGEGPVADVGCGPGYATAFLRDLGVDAFGMDLSPGMVELARAAYPDLRFEPGSMEAVDVEDGALAGVLARYSIIHTPPEEVPAAFAEFARVLAPGGHLLISFQAHDDGDVEAFDHTVTLAYRWSPDRVAALLREVGLAEVARLVIAADQDPKRGFPQAHLLAAKAK